MTCINIKGHNFSHLLKCYLHNIYPAVFKFINTVDGPVSQGTFFQIEWKVISVTGAK